MGGSPLQALQLTTDVLALRGGAERRWRRRLVADTELSGGGAGDADADGGSGGGSISAGGEAGPDDDVTTDALGEQLPSVGATAPPQLSLRQKAALLLAAAEVATLRPVGATLSALLQVRCVTVAAAPSSL